MLDQIINFFKPTKLNTQPMISKDMNYIYEAVKNHLNMDTTGALFVTGDWGSGKTYFMKNVLFPKIEAETKYKPIIVSLYGATDKNSIANKVILAYLEKAGENKFVSIAGVQKGVRNIFESVTWLKKYVDLNKLFTGSSEDLFRLLPKDELLICFDDLERISEKVKTEDFLGTVNDLVEVKGNKVMIIANEDEINGGIKFKEKTIEKTVHFSNDLSSIFDSIVAAYTIKAKEFEQYLTNNKGFIIETLSPSHTDKEKEKELKISFGNIRTVKFAIEHLRLTFDIFNAERNIEDESVKKQLQDIWLFILGLSVEFRKPKNISYETRKKLNEPVNPLSSDELAKLIWGGKKSDEPVVESDWSFRDDFVNRYYTRLDKKYIYFDQVYNLVTSGKSIDVDLFLKETEEIYKITDGKVNPSHELLDRFMGGYWLFSDLDFVAALKQLYEYAKQGEFEDLLSYLNTASYLMAFSHIMGLDKDNMTKGIKTGMEITLQNVKITSKMADQLEMAAGQYEDEHVKEILAFAAEKLKEKKNEEDKNEFSRLESLFRNDIAKFLEELTPPESSNIINPEQPIFKEFNFDNLDDAINNWQPVHIVELQRFFKRRYLGNGFTERLTGEIPFLESFSAKLSAFNDQEKPLTYELIKNQLLVTVTKCIAGLKVLENQGGQNG